METVTQRLSQERAISCTLAEVAPLNRVYRWWTADSALSQGWGTRRNTLNMCPSVLAVTNRAPLCVCVCVCACVFVSACTCLLVFSVRVCVHRPGVKGESCYMASLFGSCLEVCHDSAYYMTSLM